MTRSDVMAVAENGVLQSSNKIKGKGPVPLIASEFRRWFVMFQATSDFEDAQYINAQPRHQQSSL